MSHKLSILIADEDSSVVQTLNTVFSKIFKDIKIYTALDGNSAWEILNSQQPHIALISLHLHGKSGLDLLTKCRNHENLKNTYVIIITTNLDQNEKSKAFELDVDDFINKPFQNDTLLMRIKSAIKFINLRNKYEEENHLLLEIANQLENDVQDMIKLSVKFIQSRVPSISEMLKRVANASVWIGKTFGELDQEQIRDLEMSAFLSQAGRIFLPDNLLNKPVMIDGRPTDNIMSQVPISGKEIVSTVSRFNEVANIILHIYENFDGSGIPNRLQSWQIPFQSRIIRVCLDYEELREKTGKRPSDVVNLLKKDSNRFYDPRVITLMEHYVKSYTEEEYDPNEYGIQVVDMKPGMCLTRDIVTVNGMKLLPSGTKLTDHLIKMVFAHSSNDPILAGVFVKK